MQYGDIGQIIKDGRQVGGFLGWDLEVQIEETTSAPSRQYTTQKVKASSDRYWLNEKIESGKYTCIFYRKVGKELLALFQNELKVKIPEIRLDEYISKPLVMES
jgi:hypothetical protein